MCHFGGICVFVCVCLFVSTSAPYLYFIRCFRKEHHMCVREYVCVA